MMWLLLVWFAGWLTTWSMFLFLNRKELGVFQAITRFLLCFYLWPFYAGCYVYFRVRKEL